MTQPLALLFGVHAHQPVGNFPSVINEAHLKCYRPFFDTLYRYPEFRFAAHFSGWLLTELEAKYPEDLARLHEMVARGQVEMFGGGIAEPVLAAIPERDRRGQLDAMTAHLASTYGSHPTGAWLTERVWESSVVSSLAASGLRYVTVDDYHFLCTGVPTQALDCHYTTEDGGVALDLFPIAEGLRYRLPFAPAEEAVSYLESLAHRGDRAAIYFDDIEKFGIWPETYAWVYERGWLTEFIERVLASPHLKPTTYADFHATTRSRGVIYLPTTSYSEMNEWTLPAAAAAVYRRLVDTAKAADRLAIERPYLRGGIWRNFLSRYPEANWMHKRMLALSARLASLPTDNTAEHRQLLYQAQANDAYWHGLFGGIYLPHLRRAIWKNLLALEARLPAAPAGAPSDVDLDGHDELILRTTDALCALRDDGGGALHELSSFTLTHNFGDTLRRSTEHYFATIAAADPEHADVSATDGISSAHDRIAFKQPLDLAGLIPDTRGRGLFMDGYVTADFEPLADYQLIGTTADGAILMTMVPALSARLHKTYQLTGNELRVSYHLEPPQSCTLATRIHLAMPSCDGFGGRYRLADGTIPGGFGQELVQDALAELKLEDSELGGYLQVTSSSPIACRAAPFYTVSQSEAGFEQIMQAAGLEFTWNAAAPLTITLTIAMTIAKN
jgi:4-alpha-glucanotransferase